jgi:hypothetical protein
VNNKQRKVGKPGPQFHPDGPGKFEIRTREGIEERHQGQRTMRSLFDRRPITIKTHGSDSIGSRLLASRVLPSVIVFVHSRRDDGWNPVSHEGNRLFISEGRENRQPTVGRAVNYIEPFAVKMRLQLRQADIQNSIGIVIIVDGATCTVLLKGVVRLAQLHTEITADQVHFPNAKVKEEAESHIENGSAPPEPAGVREISVITPVEGVLI